MAYEVLGYGRTEFKPDDSDRPICGTTLYVGYEREGFVGIATERIFLSDKKAGDFVPQVGDLVDIRYNRFGKVEAVELK